MNRTNHRRVATVIDQCISKKSFNCILVGEDGLEVNQIIAFHPRQLPVLNVHFTYDITYDHVKNSLIRFHGMQPAEPMEEVVLEKGCLLSDDVRQWKDLSVDDLYFRYYLYRLQLLRYISDDNYYITQLETSTMAKLYDMLVGRIELVPWADLGPEFFYGFKLRVLRHQTDIPFPAPLMELNDLAKQGVFIRSGKKPFISKRLTRKFKYLKFHQEFFVGDVAESGLMANITPKFNLFVPSVHYKSRVPPMHHNKMVDISNLTNFQCDDSVESIILINPSKIDLNKFLRLIKKLPRAKYISVYGIELDELNHTFQVPFNMYQYFREVCTEETSTVHDDEPVCRVHSVPVDELGNLELLAPLIVTRQVYKRLREQYPYHIIDSLSALKEYHGRIVVNRYGLRFKHGTHYFVDVVGDRVLLHDVHSSKDSKRIQVTKETIFEFLCRAYIEMSSYDNVVYGPYTPIVETDESAKSLMYNNNKDIYRIKV